MLFHAVVLPTPTIHFPLGDEEGPIGGGPVAVGRVDSSQLTSLVTQST